VAELRGLAFDLVKDIPGRWSYAADDVSLASVRMQSVANELGVIEGLLAETAEAAAVRTVADREAA
jgi:hypothetical protein